MKIKLTYYLLVFTLFIAISCNDEVTYHSNFEEESILYCIINADSNNQYAILEKSFENKNDVSNNYITGANVLLKSQYNDISMLERIGDGIKLPNNYYSTDNFNPVSGSTISIEAILPNKESLSSTITLPQFSLFFFDLEELNIPFNNFSTDYKINWNIKTKAYDIGYLATMYIDYSITKNGQIISKRIEVPAEYKSNGRTLVPIYNSVTNLNFEYFNQSAISKTMELISEGDTSKSSYQINGGTVDLFILEENLATYFASSETFRNTYSVKLFETVISNIEGGKGIFGAFVKRSLPLNISHSYIRSFGYIPKEVEE